VIRRLLSALALSLLVCGTVAVTPALASGIFTGVDCSGAASKSAVCKDKGSTENPVTGDNGLLSKITNIVAAVAGAAAVILILVSGIRFITAGGDANQASSARRTLIYALVGLVVIVLARAIIALVISKI
jgi:hypothetical protein